MSVDKTEIHVTIPKSLHEKFDDFVLRKWGTKRKKGYELARAIQRHLEEEDGNFQPFEKSKDRVLTYRSDVKEKLRQIVTELLTFEEGFWYSLPVLLQIIMAQAKVSDRRTVMNYLDILRAEEGVFLMFSPSMVSFYRNQFKVNHENLKRLLEKVKE
ncbi:hypothetical protein DRP07_10365 [Archaeoglobales archaeon]|nr:MAG: hypothetical protein DRP07_10365 [Archaeoglobales archaeon]